jgi:hypothetical protein
VDENFDGGQPSAYGLSKTIAEALAAHPGVAAATLDGHAAQTLVRGENGSTFKVVVSRVRT